LPSIETLADDARKRVNARWGQLAEVVFNWLISIAGKDRKWQEIWQRQHKQPPIYCTWTAVPWLPMGHIQNPENLRGRALPAQQKDFRKPSSEEDRTTIEARRKRLAAWLPKETWAHYELAREVYAFSNLEYHQMERGFDYSLTHHQLSVRHELRKAASPERPPTKEPWEKCTLCGYRDALCGDGGEDHLEGMRESARNFWKRKDLDPDESGKERLCAVCAMKRFLVEADQNPLEKNIGSFNKVWAGMDSSFESVADPAGKGSNAEIRVPFPSTAMISAQQYIEAVASDPDMQSLLADIVRKCETLQLPRTAFPRALPRLSLLHENADPLVRRFMEYDAEMVLFPETADGKAHGLNSEKNSPEANNYTDLKKAVQRLRRETRKKWSGQDNDNQKSSEPGTQLAVIRLDGDHMGRLLLGEAEAIGARWRDVLHPGAIDQLNNNQHLLKAGWADLLDLKRLMGPSLHAFISRALAHFSHTIVPWVVEQEFSGRLIYSGGDDVLCLAPALEAMDLAARLQQLFSSAWIIDSNPVKDQWAWRRRGWEEKYDQQKSRRRFVIPLMPSKENDSIRFPISNIELLEPHACGETYPPISERGQILPMLGRGAGLSAGIAIGHFKTPLSVFLNRSADLLKFAKEPFREANDNHLSLLAADWHGRRALAVGHASRGGEKTSFALPWGEPGKVPEAHIKMRHVIEGFQTGHLSSRLPYKLRELAVSTYAGLKQINEREMSREERQNEKDKLLDGLYRCCSEASDSPEYANNALDLWKQGIKLYPEQPDRYTDGLLFCRALASKSDYEGSNES
jgi:CRISPR-associated protein Cmr2